MRATPAPRPASGDWLLFVDADSSPSRALFQDLLEVIEGGGCIGGGARLACDSTAQFVNEWIAVWNFTSRVMRWAVGAFLFCHAEAWRAIGGFSEALYAGEEIDLSNRLGRASRREFVILQRHPLLTSGRKAHLYSWRAHAAFLASTILTGGRMLRRREFCTLWYDGRR